MVADHHSDVPLEQTLVPLGGDGNPECYGKFLWLTSEALLIW